jgi:hypothetical protein
MHACIHVCVRYVRIYVCVCMYACMCMRACMRELASVSVKHLSPLPSLLVPAALCLAVPARQGLSRMLDGGGGSNVCMAHFLCVYVHKCVCTYVYACMEIIHVCVYTYMSVHDSCRCVYVCMYMCVPVHIWVYERKLGRIVQGPLCNSWHLPPVPPPFFLVECRLSRPNIFDPIRCVGWFIDRSSADSINYSLRSLGQLVDTI